MPINSRRPSRTLVSAAAAIVLGAVCANAAVRADESKGECNVPTPAVSVAPFVPSAAQRNDMLVTLHSPPVAAVREQFNAAAAGTPTTPRTERALAPFPAGLLRDRFAIMNDQRSTPTERIFTVLFKHHASTLYQVWVDDLGSGGPWEVRGFGPLPCSSEQMRFVQNRYGAYIASLPGA